MNNFEISKKLHELRAKAKKVEALVCKHADTSDWMAINSIAQIGDKEVKEEMLNLLVSLGLYDDLWVSVVNQPQPMISTSDPEIFEWFRTDYPPIHKKAFELVLDDVASNEFGRPMPPTERTSAVQCKNIKTEKFKNAFVDMVRFSRDYMRNRDYENDPLEEELRVNDCEKIIKKWYFEPDAWDENELPPVVVTRNLGEVPEPVRLRIDQIRKSFLFGNWMAVIALSRCLLEYAIRKNAKLFGIDENEKMRLDELIKVVKKQDAALGDLMLFIREKGNAIMHPDPADETADENINRKDIAGECFENIAKIIGSLYSAKTPDEYRNGKTSDR